MLVRTDLTLPQQFCQAAHAAHEAGIRFGNPARVSSIVLCSVPDEASLIRAKDRLDRKGIRSYVFLEDDLGNQATSLATEPISGSSRRVLGEFPLWNGSPLLKEVNG